MTQIFSTNLLILGTIDSLLDQVNMKQNRLETRNMLLSAIMSRFISAMLEDASFAQYIREIAPKLEGKTDVDTVLKVTNDQLVSKGINLDLEPLMRSQAKAVLAEFAGAAQSEVPNEQLVVVVETALA